MKKTILCLMAMMGIMTVSAQQKVENRDAQAAISNIMTRTSIRQYTNEPVTKVSYICTHIVAVYFCIKAT